MAMGLVHLMHPSQGLNDPGPHYTYPSEHISDHPSLWNPIVTGCWSSQSDSNPFSPPFSNAASGCGWRAIPAPLRVLITSTPFPVVKLIVFYLRKLQDMREYKKIGSIIK